MAFEGLDLPIGKETQKYITLEVNKLEDIIINSINKVYGSHIGYITKQLKEALIENAIEKKIEYIDGVGTVATIINGKFVREENGQMYFKENK